MRAFSIVRGILQISTVTAVIVLRIASGLLGSRGHEPFNVMVSDSFKPQLNVYIA